MITWYIATQVNLAILTVAFNEWGWRRPSQICHLIPTVGLDAVRMLLLLIATGGMDQNTEIFFISGGLNDSHPVFSKTHMYAILDLSNDLPVCTKEGTDKSVMPNHSSFKKSNICRSFSVKLPNKSWIMALTQIIDSMLLFSETEKRSKTMPPQLSSPCYIWTIPFRAALDTQPATTHIQLSLCPVIYQSEPRP